MTTISDAELERAVALLRAPRVICAGHMDPDADALGSALALTHALRVTGVDAHATVGARPGTDPAVPQRLQDLPGSEALLHPDDIEPAPEVLVVCDCADPSRLGTLANRVETAGTVVWLDHHEGGRHQGGTALVDPAASSTAEIVAELIRHLGVPLTGDVATCLYAGLVTDTGRFSHPSTTAPALRLASELVDGGVDVEGLTRRLFITTGFDALRLLGRVLADARRTEGLVWSEVSEAELAAAGLASSDTDDLIDSLRRVEDAACVLLLKHRDDGRVKGSLRSVGDVEVAPIARSLGGGGHARAAGFDTEADVEVVVAHVVAALNGSRTGTPRHATAGEG